MFRVERNVKCGDLKNVYFDCVINCGLEESFTNLSDEMFYFYLIISLHRFIFNWIENDICSGSS